MPARSFGVFQEARQEVVWVVLTRQRGRRTGASFPPIEIKRTLPDGALKVRFIAGGLLEMAWHLFTWGLARRVIQPRLLREKYVDALRSGALVVAKRKGGTTWATQPCQGAAPPEVAVTQGTTAKPLA